MRRVFLAFALALPSKQAIAPVFLALLAVAALVAAEPELRIAVNSTTIESFPLFVAAAAIPQIQLLPTPNGRSAMAQLVSGAVDAATGSETQALLNSMSDPRIRIVLTLSECRYRIIARRSAGIRGIADLRGRKVAITSNTSSHYYLTRILQKAQLKDSDVQLMNMEGQEMPAALDKRSVDAVSIWEPHAENSRLALGNDFIVLEDPAAYTERFNLNTRTDVLADPAKRRALSSLIQEIARASARIRTRPAELVPSLASRIDIPASTVTAVWSQFRFPANVSAGLRPALYEVEPWVAATQNRQPRARGDLAALVDDTLVTAALR
jgi:sulfonate transport system substrate-binding protein